MADTLGVTIDVSEFVRLLRGLENRERAIRRVVQTVAKDVGIEGERRIKEDYLTGGKLRVRSGTLRSSISHRVDIDEVSYPEPGVRAFVRIGVLRARRQVIKYAAALEYGAEVTPKQARLLTIPTQYAQDPSGNKLFSARGSRDIYPFTKWFNFGGTPLLVGFVPGTKQAIPLFRGAKRVLIGGGRGRGYRFLRDALDEQARRAPRLLMQEVTKILNGGS